MTRAPDHPGDRSVPDDQARKKDPIGAVISIGDEIVAGETLDTNSRWLAGALADLGVRVVEHVSIGDDEREIADALTRLADRVGFVVSTGGLGPTADDLTRQALASAMGAGLVEDASAAAALRARYAARFGPDKPIPALVLAQALCPTGATMIANPVGTAPGLRARLWPHGGSGRTPAGCRVWCLPGPPAEMRAMLEAGVAPEIRAALEPFGAQSGAAGVSRGSSETAQNDTRHEGGGASPPAKRFVHLVGLTESVAAERLGALLDRRREPQVGITVSQAVITLRIRERGATGIDSAERIESTVREVRERVGEYIFGEGDITLAEACAAALRSRGQTLACVESCTGGMVSALMTDAAGSSDVFLGGWVTYSNRMKSSQVNVPPEVLAQHGAVSIETAAAMARGGRRRSGASYAIAITGIAGPGGGTGSKPVGTVCIALARVSEFGRADDEIDVRRVHVPGTRADVRSRSAALALGLLYLHLTRSAAIARSVRWTWESPLPASPPR